MFSFRRDKEFRSRIVIGIFKKISLLRISNYRRYNLIHPIKQIQSLQKTDLSKEWYTKTKEENKTKTKKETRI